MHAHKKLTLTCTGLLLAINGASTYAVNYSINWLNMPPTPFGSSVPNNSVFNLPGVGNVTLTYSVPSVFAHSRGQNPLWTSGNVTSGLDNYAWTNWEQFGATSNAPNPPFVTTQWSVTYTFSGVIPAGTLYVSAGGLGQTSSFGGGASTAVVNQNGTFLGDWSGGGNYGPTQFTGGVGTFSMQNSLTGPGGQDPHWNSMLGVVRINDPVNSLTIFVNSLPGDGIGVNIGAIPEPASLGLFALAGLAVMRRGRGRAPRG
jgi:hypothetical protein